MFYDLESVIFWVPVLFLCCYLVAAIIMARVVPVAAPAPEELPEELRG
ncbi:hypothetical protein [Formicincola oecophyllae]|nr:hypothetical protein [Formicincola oecophyllae]